MSPRLVLGLLVMALAPACGPDNDGDGVFAEQDCDDADPAAWLPDAPYAGVLNAEIPVFCEGYCARSVAGDVEVNGSLDTDLSALACLTEVQGSVSVTASHALTDLSGLDRLTEIGGFLSVSQNAALSDLGGLEVLSVVRGGLTIAENGALLSLLGLRRLAVVGDGVVIQQNHALGSLEGLEQVSSVDGALVVADNRSLTSLSGLSGLQSVEADLYLGDNDALPSLDGLESLHRDCAGFRKWNGDFEAAARTGARIQLEGSARVAHPFGHAEEP